MFMVLVKYPSREDELEIYKRTTSQTPAKVECVLHSSEITRLQDVVRKVPIGEPAYQFALEVVRATRPNEPGASDFIRHWLNWGAGPRAGQYLINGAKARALMHGRMFVGIDDLIAVAPAVLRHRLIPNFNAEAEGVTVEQIIQKVLAIVPRGKSDKLL